MPYVQVGELNMYYETHGEGRPLVLLHGAYMSVDTNGPILPALAADRQVIAFEQQGHGRTADIDRPISYEQMAEDTAAAVRELGIGDADFFGYSMGGAIALVLAVRHPDLVRKLVLASTSYTSEGFSAEARAMFPTITPELFRGTPIEEEYLRLAPDPDHFEEFVAKMVHLDTVDFAVAEDDVRAIPAPTLIIVGDSDGVTLDHAVEFFKLRGGGVMGDLAGMPASQLAVLPGTSHFVPPGSGLMDRTEWMLPMIRSFLDS